MGRGGVACALLLTALASPMTLHAQTAADAEQGSEVKQARALFDEGNQLVEKGKWLEALEKFRAAYGLWANPKILLNIGTTLRQLGRNAEAADTYQKYLAHPQADPARLAEVKAALAETEALSGKLEIESKGKKRRILVDSKLVAETDGTVVVRVDPGGHTVLGDRDGETLITRVVAVAAGERRVVELSNEAPPPSPKVTPPISANEPGAPSSAPSDRPSSGSSQKTIAGVVAGVGVVSVAIGTIYGLSAKSKRDQSFDQCRPDAPNLCSQDGATLRDQAITAGNVSTVAFGIGAVALVSGVVLWLTAPSPKESNVSLRVAPGIGGAWLVGAW